MDDEPKSAYELALEKLKQRDRDRGEDAPLRLTDDQKAEIAEIRRVHEARMAEREILHRSERAKAMATGDAEALEKLEQDYARDRRRIEEERDAKIAATRAAAADKGAVSPPPAGKKGGGAGATPGRKAAGKEGRRR
jgi:hypothetical protein